MKVSIKKFNVEMILKNSGMELEIRSNGDDEFLGDLKVTKSGLEWCKGKTQNGVKKKWEEVIRIFENSD